jgi:ribosome maturation factor RimP
MSKAKIEKTVEEIAIPIIDGLGYELVDVEFVMESKEWYLRVYIDKEEGISIDDCSIVSRALSDKLDEIDPIDYSYYLEVSSPGIERPLKKEQDFIRFAGQEIKINLYKSLEGKKSVVGTLKGLENNVIILECDGQEVKIDRDLASSVRLKGI